VTRDPQHGRTDLRGDHQALPPQRRALLGAAAATLAVDLLTKVVASALLPGRPVHLAGPLYLRLVHNPGVAFGLGDDAPAALLLLITGAVVAALARAAWYGRVGPTIPAGLILGGAAANLIDRAHAGTVIDMFDLTWLNVADIGITAGAALLMLRSLRSKPAAT
jgi:signal peptidase II